MRGHDDMQTELGGVTVFRMDIQAPQSTKDRKKVYFCVDKSATRLDSRWQRDNMPTKLHLTTSNVPDLEFPQHVLSTSTPITPPLRRILFTALRHSRSVFMGCDPPASSPIEHNIILLEFPRRHVHRTLSVTIPSAPIICRCD